MIVAEPIIVIDDFAHHPTAIAATLEAVRRRHSSRKIWAVLGARIPVGDGFSSTIRAALRDADAV